VQCNYCIEEPQQAEQEGDNNPSRFDTTLQLHLVLQVDLRKGVLNWGGRISPVWHLYERYTHGSSTALSAEESC